MGDWVLLAALQRIEAGTLHACSGRPKHTRISQYPWYISVCQVSEDVATTDTTDRNQYHLPSDQLSKIR
jgi:hypothetical protein